MNMPDLKVMEQPFLNHKKGWVIFLLSITTSVISMAIIHSLLNSQLGQKNPSLSSLATTLPVNTVSARGRIEPQDGVVRLSASTSVGTVKIKRLLVKEGDKVTSNQVIAILDNYNRLVTALKEAKQQVKVAQANLAKVKAGAKIGEIKAQQATIARLQAQLLGEINTQQATIARLQAQLLGQRKTQQAVIARLQAQLNNAYTEFERFQRLYKEGAVEASKFDSKHLELETAREQLNEAQANLDQTEEILQQQINEAKSTLKQTKDTLQEQIKEAKANLDQIAEVRPTDVQAVQAEVESAIAALEKAQAEQELTYVRAPKNGQILKIYAFPGELISSEGIADIGQTHQMYVVAEVYETDVSRVKIGQQAKITSEAFLEELSGEVTQVGLQVKKQASFSTDPVADVDRRVVEVKIRLNQEDTKQVKSLINLQVEVVINTEKSPSLNDHV